MLTVYSDRVVTGLSEYYKNMSHNKFPLLHAAPESGNHIAYTKNYFSVRNKCMLRPFNTSFLCLFFLLLSNTRMVFAQLELVPIWRTPPPEVSFKKNLPNARTSGAAVPMLLPFWDDFSLNKFDPLNNTAYPNDTLWEYSRRVWVNDQMGINPPSIYVATFDGYDSLGKPYAKNDILAKGFADRLTSRPLRMDLVAQANRPRVFMSFFYQIQGNGERPDPGDVLSLEFKDNRGIWNEVWKVEANNQMNKAKFDTVRIKNLNDEYFHDKFQFRFKNFGRLSGSYDTWNVDYVYVSNGIPLYIPAPKPGEEPKKFRDFPDRTIVSGLTSLFKEYQSMPLKHFRLDTSLTLQPSITVSNQRKDQTLSNENNPQSFNVNLKVKILKTQNNTTSASDFAFNQTGNKIVVYYQDLIKVNFTKLPPDLKSIDADIERMSLDFKGSIDAGDNTPKTSTEGDFDTIAYKRIDFRYNDTTRRTYVLDDYYAYDDGTAEYGARINGIGTQLAYEFNLKNNNAADTVIAIDYYFPPFGDESSQSVQFHVLGALTGQETDYLYRRNTVIKRSANNVFVRETLASPIVVQSKFYIGWRLLSNALIPVGLDRSVDSGDKLFINPNGDWVQNTALKGSLMIRPVFIRKGETPPIVGVEDGPVTSLYPNPNNGVFYLPSQSEQISVVDMTGKPILITVEDQQDQKKISIEAAMGIYVVRYFDGKWKSIKMAIKP
jgi:hypothetical protein